MVIGKGGLKLKSIGIAARKEIEKIFSEKVSLNLHVKVEPNWSKSSAGLRKVGIAS